uniref:Uncharacterized protein n=1 Tax=Parascaris univalens TaxID=6257 RepID=A0A915BSS3_PARUN
MWLFLRRKVQKDIVDLLKGKEIGLCRSIRKFTNGHRRETNMIERIVEHITNIPYTWFQLSS